MPKQYKLTITNPCSEPWSEMTPSEQGRFCAYCAKNVVDFTLMSDSQIAQYLQDTKGLICGRLTHAQLDRVYSVGMTYRTKPQFAAYLAALMLLNSNNSPVTAHPGLREVEWAPLVIPLEQPAPEITTVTSDSLLIKGIVLDSITLQPVDGVFIKCDTSFHNLVTDSTGRFEIWVPATAHPAEVHLQFWGRNYALRNQVIAKDKLPVEMQVILPRDNAIIYGGLEVYDYLAPDTLPKH